MFDILAKGISKIFGSKSEKDLKLIRPRVPEINAEYAKLAALTDEELRHKTAEFKDFIAAGLADSEAEITALREKAVSETDLNEKEAIFNQVDKLLKDQNQILEAVLDQLLPQAFAVVKETARRWAENGSLTVRATDLDLELAAKRDGIRIEGENAVWINEWSAAGSLMKWEMLHYDVQLIGGIVLHQGKIAEMATGEGKTLVATLPAYLNGIAGRGVHIVTVNNYLAKRDSEWMGPLFEFHGLRVDCIDKHKPNTDARRAAYHADITYGTNNEFGFDYLRDNMSRTPEELVQRKHHYAMVDEVDSVLIDDARTPLIISGPVPKGDDTEIFALLKPRIAKLVENQKRITQQFLTDAKKKIAEGNDNEGALSLFRAYRGLPKNRPLIKYLGEPGIKQKMMKVENFYMQENSKMMPEADEPLLFTIEEKNNSIELTERGLDAITGDSEDKEFFILPDIGLKTAEIDNEKGLTEDEILQAKEVVFDEYAVKAQRIHIVNQLLKAYTLFEKDVDYIIEEDKVKIVDEQTGRTMEGRRFSDGLHQALEAKENVKIEDSTQTYATVTLQNYFRMYHKLSGMTGTAETEEGEFWEIYKLDVVVIPTNRPIVRDDRQDKVYKTVREKFNAVADEIQELAEAGRPILVGTTSVEISELLSRMLKMKKIEHQVLNAKQHAREAEVVAIAGRPGNVTIATNMAGRGTDIKLTPESKASGGLAIIGTERHESRRVDRQLRGRAGRQGDPGSSQFFVSLEDNLMRLFSSDRIVKVMDRLGLEEGEVIQHSMITKSIERAQKKVEENNFGMRKRLLEYDDVMNSQREVIYTRRRNALYGERLSLDIMTMIYDTAEQIAENNLGAGKELKLQAHSVLGVTISDETAALGTSDALTMALYEQALKHYNEKNQAIAQKAVPVLRNILEQHGDRVEIIRTLFTDRRRQIGVETNLKQSVESEGKLLIDNMEQSIVLALIDQEWKEHLRNMDDLRQQVSFSHLEQKDPLMIYKFEAFQMFKNFLDTLNEDIVSFLAKSDLYEEEKAQAVTDRPQQRKPDYTEHKEESGSVLSSKSDNTKTGPTQQEEVTKPIVSQKVANRNDVVKVRYADGTVKEAKYKKIEADLESGRCMLIG